MTIDNKSSATIKESSLRETIGCMELTIVSFISLFVNCVLPILHISRIYKLMYICKCIFFLETFTGTPHNKLEFFIISKYLK